MKVLAPAKLIFFIYFFFTNANTQSANAEKLNLDQQIKAIASSVYSLQPDALEKLIAFKKIVPPDSIEYAKYWMLHGAWLQLNKNFDSALVYLDSAQSFAIKIEGNGFVNRRVQYQRITCLEQKGQLNTAIKYAANLVKAFEAIKRDAKDQEVYIYTLVELSKYLYFNNAYAESMEAIAKVLPFLESDSTGRFLALKPSILINQCICATALSLKTAEAICLQSLLISKESNDEINEGISQSNLGSYYLEVKNYKSANSYLVSAKNIFEKYQDERHLGPVYANLAHYHFKEKNYEVSKAYLEKSIKLLEKHNQLHYLVEVYFTAINVYAHFANMDALAEAGVKFKYYQDKHNNEQKAKEIARIKANFEFAQKESEIVALQQKSEHNKTLLELRNAQYKRLVLAILLVIILLLFILYYSIRLKLKEKQLAAANTQLKDMDNKKNQIISILGHDLRTPINQMIAMQDELIINNFTTQERNIVAMEINQSLNQGLGMIDNILTWARSYMQGEPQLQQLMIHETVIQVIEQISKQAKEKGILILHHIEPFEVTANVYLVEIIIRNLLTNALKFSAPNSKVEIFYQNSNGRKEVLIKDYGGGMPKHIVEMLNNGQKSQKLKPSYGTLREPGSGIGLSLAADLAAKTNAKISVEATAPSQGTIMKVTFF